jgi:hypothetical protein
VAFFTKLKLDLQEKKFFDTKSMRVKVDWEEVKFYGLVTVEVKRVTLSNVGDAE